VFRTALLACALLALAAPARAGSDLFACRVIVTGTDARSRPEGLARCVRDVVVKVTGHPSLADDPRTSGIAQRADELVEDFVYLDRMTDIPHHDEQGTRDRPFDLIAHLDPDRLRQALAAAGLRLWLDRPTLAVSVAIRARDGASFRMTPEDDESERHRQALLAAADRFGMRVALATKRATSLDGELVWSEPDFGWNAAWRLLRNGAEQARWTVRGVSFDEAYRAGVGGAAERLAP
jgi:hypothetical protein